MAKPFKTYKEIQPNTWTARLIGKNSIGAPTILVLDPLTNEAPVFTLYADGEAGQIVFPIEPHNPWR